MYCTVCVCVLVWNGNPTLLTTFLHFFIWNIFFSTLSLSLLAGYHGDKVRSCTAQQALFFSGFAQTRESPPSRLTHRHHIFLQRFLFCLFSLCFCSSHSSSAVFLLSVPLAFMLIDLCLTLLSVQKALVWAPILVVGEMKTHTHTHRLLTHPCMFILAFWVSSESPQRLSEGASFFLVLFHALAKLARLKWVILSLEVSDKMLQRFCCEDVFTQQLYKLYAVMTMVLESFCEACQIFLSMMIRILNTKTYSFIYYGKWPHLKTLL